MTTKYSIYAVIIGVTLLLSFSLASAVPTAGAASGITTNSFNITVAGSDGGDTWIAWGEAPGAHGWGSSFRTGDGVIKVYGAPIIGGSTIYYVACDSTGCDSTEQTLSIPAITPVPTTTFGVWYRNMTNQHFAVDSIAPNILPGYLATGMSATLLWGIMCFFIWFGFWFRTRSVRMAIMMGLLMASFILTPMVSTSVGALGLSVPLMFQYVAQGLMAAAIAGILVSFIRK